MIVRTGPAGDGPLAGGRPAPRGGAALQPADKAAERDRADGGAERPDGWAGGGCGHRVAVAAELGQSDADGRGWRQGPACQRDGAA